VTDLFLGIIALAVVTMAAIQVAAIVFAAKAARRVDDAVSRLQEDVRPIVANLQTVAAEAARATASVASQVERSELMLTDLSRRVDETVAALQQSILTPARNGFAIVQGIKAALAAFRAGPRPRSRGNHVEEEDALFIG
jgi:hypothetical protein